MKNIKTIIFLLWCIVGNIQGMDLKIARSPQACAEENQRLAYGFLSTSFFHVRALTQNLSSDKRDKIRKKIINDKAKNGQLLFNVATILPPDLQKKIAMILGLEDEAQVKIFLKTPIRNGCLYVWAQQVFSGKVFPELKLWSQDNPNWNVGTIFAHSKDIQVFEERCNSDWSRVFGRKKLEAIDKVCNTFLNTKSKQHIKMRQVAYTFRDCYTLSNFKKQQSIDQWALLGVLLIPFAVKLLAQYWYPNFSIQEMEKMSREYDAQQQVNDFVRDKYESTKDDAYLSLLSTKFSKVDEYMQNNVADRYYVYYWSYLVPGVLVGFVGGEISHHRIEVRMRKEEDKEWDKYSKMYRFYRFFVPACGLVFGYFTGTLSTIVFGSYISEAIERPAFGMACIAGCYAAAVSLWNVIKMRTIREEYTKIDQIPQLLKRTDIEII